MLRSENEGGFKFSDKHVDRILSRISKDLSAEGRAALRGCLQVCADWYQDALRYNLRAKDEEQVFAKRARNALSTVLRDTESERPELLDFLDIHSSKPH